MHEDERALADRRLGGPSPLTRSPPRPAFTFRGFDRQACLSRGADREPL